MADETVQAPQSIEVVVKNKHGMHLRCCGEVARIANGFKSHITMKNSRRETDAKSMLGLTTLAAACGSRILITAVGPDANDALSALNNYFSCDSE
ncbi:MAG: HPr family phosphocarrier protein [Victivallales bacterium]|nr:HPr family phosphocarrier protein [Victivallales bacterium]